MDVVIQPVNKISGDINIPGDKSISHRAIMLGALATGDTEAENFLTGDDCISTVNAFKEMQVEISIVNKKLIVRGKGLKGFKKPKKELYLGNSGTTIRLISGILSGQEFETVLTGDESLSRRPMKRIIDPLTLMGADIVSLEDNGCAPLRIRGRGLNPIRYKTKVASAQVKSCVLLAGLFADGETGVEEPFLSRDHTERMLEYFGVPVKHNDNIISLTSDSSLNLKAKKFYIPGDVSSAAFFIVLATIFNGASLLIKSVGINPTRRKIIDVLIRMGADIKLENQKDAFEPYCDLRISGASLRGTVVHEDEIASLIDEIPILTVAAAKAEGVTEIRGVSELRVKETDRIHSMVSNLKNMGVDISGDDDIIVIRGNKDRFKKADLVSYGDHRTAMALSIAACFSEGECCIDDVDCVKTSFPDFFEILQAISK